MAIPKVKGTYSLDVETVELIAETARAMGTSKSDILRRAVHDYAAKYLHKSLPDPLDALQRLQDGLALDDEGASRWIEQIEAERDQFPPDRDP